MRRNSSSRARLKALSRGAPEQIEADLEIAGETKKPSFPLLPAARAAAVMAAFLGAEGAVPPAAIAQRFKQGRQVQPAIERTLRALAPESRRSRPWGLPLGGITSRF